MTDRTRDWVSGLLGLSGLLCVIGAVIARQTGEELYFANGQSFRTHQDAFVVLLVLGIVLLVNMAVIVIHAQQTPPVDQRSDW